MKSLLTLPIDVVFPPICVGCGDSLVANIHSLLSAISKSCGFKEKISPPTASEQFQYLCKHCEPSLIWIDERRCPICGIPSLDIACCLECQFNPPDYTQLISVFEYAGVVADILKRAKYNQDLTYLRILFEWGRERLKGIIDATLKEERNVLLTWVPMEPAGLAKRGFDPPYILLHWLGYTPTPLFVKVKGGKRQASLDKAERLKNASRNFQINTNKISCLKGKRVCIFDDVITTGATMAALAHTLKTLGAIEVIGLSLARTPSSTS